jgi:N-acetylneuraminic acid mutarotase
VSVKDPNRIPRAALVTLVIVLVAAWAGVSSAKPGQSERAAGGPSWQAEATMPVPRSEVAGAVVDGQIAVAGGFLADGRSSRRVDLYDPARDRWSRLPDLPLAVNHAMAAADGRRIYVVGGYGASGPVRAAFVLENGAWRRLPLQPEARAAGGAAFVGGKLYVVGGVFARGRLADEAFVFDPKRRRWSAIDGPRQREHLGVAALGGRIYAVGGRSAGFDTNVAHAEEYRPAAGEWFPLPPVPESRGGTGLAPVRGLLVSVGGEEPSGTIASVYAYDRRDRRWRQLADLRTPRHGLAVESVGGRLYAIAGGREPGLSVSGVSESLTVPGPARRTAAVAPRRGHAPSLPPP